jgi:prolyl oligopeptidase PreP (S9A serine peptidase family)
MARGGCVTLEADRYRWLEDVDAAAVRAWAAAQDARARAWLGALPQRGPLRDRLARTAAASTSSSQR